MKGLIVSLLATGALCAATPSAAASSPARSQTAVVAAHQDVDLSSRHRHWRRAHYYRGFAPRPYRYGYSPVVYPRPYYGYRTYRPYHYGPYAWGPGPFRGYGYRAPWSGHLLGIGYGW